MVLALFSRPSQGSPTLTALPCPCPQASERWDRHVQDEAAGLGGPDLQPGLCAALRYPRQPQASLGDR